MVFFVEKNKQTKTHLRTNSRLRGAGQKTAMSSLITADENP
jgi:hypothetical protein